MNTTEYRFDRAVMRCAEICCDNRVMLAKREGGGEGGDMGIRYRLYVNACMQWNKSPQFCSFSVVRKNSGSFLCDPITLGLSNGN